MRRGCISLGNVKCDVCGRAVAYPDRYLAVDEEGGVESDTGKTVRHCVDCALKKGYAQYKVEKGEKVLTFLPG